MPGMDTAARPNARCRLRRLCMAGLLRGMEAAATVRQPSGRWLALEVTRELTIATHLILRLKRALAGLRPRARPQPRA